MYWVGINNSGMYNFPEDSINGWLQVIKAENEIIVKQIFYRYGSKNSTGNYTYIRTSYNDGWSEWVKLVTNNDLQTVLTDYIEYDSNTSADAIITKSGQKFNIYEWIPQVNTYNNYHEFEYHFYNVDGYWAFWASKNQSYQFIMYKYNKL